VEEQDKMAEAIKAGGEGFEDAILEYNVRIEIPETQGMSSVDLWATLLRHEGDDKWPTIIIGTPYRREMVGAMMGIGLFPFGYNILVFDVRGTGSSEGEWVSFGPEEHTDYAYIIDHWIPAQVWSDGKSGLFGGSYMAISQMMAAGQIACDGETGEPVHLKAMFPMAPMTDAYKDIVMHGGNLDLAFIPMWLGGVDMLALLPSTLYMGGENTTTGAAADEEQMMDEITDNLMDSWNQIPVHLSWFTDIEKMTDGQFFDERSSMTYWPDKHPEGNPYFGGDKTISPKLPTFITGGWFCIFHRGASNAYQYALKNHSPEDKALIMGPWYHGDAAGSTPGIKDIGTTSRMIARWFDWKIKGIHDPFMVEFPVMIYVMGADKWRVEKEWPLPDSRTEKKTLYLSRKKAQYNWKDWFSFFNYRKNFKLVEELGKSDLKGNAPKLIHNPAELHGTLSRSMVRWTAGALAMISQEFKYTYDKNIDAAMFWEDERLDEIAALTFTTNTLKENVEITGPITLKFWAKTDFEEPVSHAYIDKLQDSIYKDIMQLELRDDNNFVKMLMDEKDVQWVVELNDVYPYGRAKNISSGWLRASHRPYNPDESEDTTEHAIDPSYTPFDPFYDGPDKAPKLIKEDEFYEYAVEIWPTSNLFKKGHKIRISISASDYPHLLPIMVPSENEIIIDEDHAATLEFTTVNTDDKGKTWEWVDDMEGYSDVDQYLMEHQN